MRKFTTFKLSVVFSGSILAAVFFSVSAVSAAPLLANYYLGTLPGDADSIAKLSRVNLLILSPEQAVTNRVIIDKIKQQNPRLIILAYLSAKSYHENWKQFPASALFNDFTVQDSWWLRDTKGRVVSNWPGLKSLAMTEAESDYLIEFARQRVLPLGVWDGILWDEVYDGIATVNGGDIDLDGDGQRDDPKWANEEWVRRINYLLAKSRRELGLKYFITNGSSLESMQGLINGRMYENFPTPWEAGGNWSEMMTRLERNKPLNLQPGMYVFNSTTNNTGRRADYRRMRFGLLSSLLSDDVYYSFDYGDQNHSQVWWYDEYDARLGAPSGAAQSLFNQTRFQEGVWRRDFEHGIALLNATNESQAVDLGGEYEKIIGRQDPAVNDGKIIDQVTLGARDGLILFKTFKKVDGVLFKNGSFLRFYRPDGSRARNGFFAYEEQFPGGAKIYHGDLNGDASKESVVITGNKLEIFNPAGERWFSDYPFGAGYQREINLASGRLASGPAAFLVTAPAAGGKVVIYNYHGGVARDEWYPLGKKYRGGFSVAVGDVLGDAGAEIVLGTGAGQAAEILIFNAAGKLSKRFSPYDKKYQGGVNVAVGDFDGDGRREIAAVSVLGRQPLARIFNGQGKKISEFFIKGFFGSPAVSLGAAEVNYGAREELVVMSQN